MIDSSLWEILVTFFHCRTLSAAAEKLYVSQPALSAAMKRLEKELAVPLFERSKNKLALNEVGLEAVRLAESHINSEKAMVRQLQEMSRRLNAITVASYVSGLRKTLADRLSNMFPERAIISEHLSSELLPRGLLDGRFDYVITEHQIDEPDVICVPYITDRLMVRFPKDDVLASISPITLNDLKNSKLLVWTQSGFWASFIRKKFESRNLVFVSDEQEYYDLLQAFDMRSFTLESSIAATDQGRYCCVPFAEEEMQVSFYLCCLKKNEAYLSSLIPRK